MPSEPPEKNSDRQRPWSPPIRRVSGTPAPPPVSAEPEPFELRGPAAPPREAEVHPVRARLLERARRGGVEAPERSTESPRAARVEAPEPALLSHHLDDDSSARLVTRPKKAEGGPRDSAPSPEPRQSAPPPEVAPEPEFETQFEGNDTRTEPPPEVTQELERFTRDGLRPRVISQSIPLSPNAQALLLTLLGISIAFSAALFVDRLYTKVELPPDGEEVTAPQAKAKEPEAPAPVREKIQGPPRITDMVEPGQRIVSGKFGREPFLKAIEQAGLPRNEAYRAFAALKDLKNLDRCGPNDTFKALLQGREKRLMAFEYIVSPEEIYQAKTDPSGRLVGQKLDLKVMRNQVRRALVITGPFEESAKKSGFDRGLGPVLEKALSGHLALSELKRGDRLRVIVQEVTVLGEFSRYAGIEAVELARAGGKNERFYYYSHPVEGGYFDASGRAPWEGGFRKPVPGAPVTSKFNPKRVNPVLKKVMPHTGTDFGAPIGTPILATKAGKITFSGWGGPNGNFVRIAHDGGYESGYSHLSRFVDGLKVGDTVERLQVIGYVGSTGRSTGPHLHFHIKKNGEYIDPESLNLDGKRVLPVSHREAFAAVRAKYDPILDAIPLPEALPEATAPAEPLFASAGNEEEMEGGPDPDEPEPARAEPAPKAPSPVFQSPQPQVAVAAAPNAAPAPNSAPAEAAKAAAPAPGSTQTRRAIFLTDAELQRAQPLTGDGEVDE